MLRVELFPLRGILLSEVPGIRIHSFSFSHGKWRRIRLTTIFSCDSSIIVSRKVEPIDTLSEEAEMDEERGDCEIIFMSGPRTTKE